MEYNVYCDESCHLPNDNSDVMVIGGIWIPKDKRKEICARIKEIKKQNDIPESYELKWVNVSKIKEKVYQDLLNYFFDEHNMHFRGVIAKCKSKLDFENFDGTYDDWYYKIYFLVLTNIFLKENKYNIYVDIKDTISSEKIKKLHEVCANSMYDFPHNIIKKIQPIRSDEVEIMQITDIIIGALSYYHRGLNNNEVKLNLIDLIKRRTNYSLNKNTLLRDTKFNFLIWRPRG